MQDLPQPLRLPRVDRWVSKRGGGLPVMTNDGAVLLDRRLRLRRCAGVTGCAIGALGAVAIMAPAHHSAAAWYSVGVVLIAAALLAWSVSVRVGERRLAAELTRRVSRDSAIPMWRQLGLLRSTNCLIVALAALVLLTALIALHAGLGVIALFAGLFVMAATLCGVVLWELAHAPALAVDDATLAAHQRLRGQSVYYAMSPLFVLVLTTMTQIRPLGGGRNPQLHRLADSSWPFGFFLAVLFIELIASELEKSDAGQRPRRRTWKPWGLWGPFA